MAPAKDSLPVATTSVAGRIPDVVERGADFRIWRIADMLSDTADVGFQWNSGRYRSLEIVE